MRTASSHTRWRIGAGITLAIAVALGACDDFIGPDPNGVAIDASSTTVVENDTLALSVNVTDEDGSAISDADIQWTSRDTTTATVSDNGVVTGVAAGDAWIVAEAGPLADSVEITVHFDVSDQQVKTRIQSEGGDDESFGWSGPSIGLSVYEEAIHPDDSNRFIALGADTVTQTQEGGISFGDTLMILGMNKLPEVGTNELSPVDKATLEAGEYPDMPFVAIGVWDTDSTASIFINTGEGELEVEELTLPDMGDWQNPGSVRGHISVEMSRYDVVFHDSTFDATPTGETATAYVGFELPVLHLLREKVTVEVIGGPEPGNWDYTSGSATVTDTTMLTYLSGQLSGYNHSSQGLHVEIDSPSVGTFAIDSSHPDMAWDTAAPPNRAWIMYPDSMHPNGPQEAHARSGTFTLDSYDPPATSSELGTTAGSLTADLLVYDSTGTAVDSASVTATFGIRAERMSTGTSASVTTRDGWTNLFLRKQDTH